jgi:hypothetical protein
MTFKPAIWRPIAIVLSAGNLVAVGFAAGAGEPLHAAVHSGLAIALGFWAQRLREQGLESEPRPGLEELEDEVSQLRQELAEAQERIDFTERMLARGQEARRAEPQP